jgi:hypothetical protein
MMSLEKFANYEDDTDHLFHSLQFIIMESFVKLFNELYEMRKWIVFLALLASLLAQLL